MHRNLFKLFIIVCFCVIFVIYGLKGLPVSANQGGPQTKLTGAPGEANCTSCHADSPVNSGGGTLTITGLPPTYMPNQEITVTVTLSQSGRSVFGFQLTAIDDQGRKAGDLVATDTARTQLNTGVVQNNLRQYIFHTFQGTSANGPNRNTWSFTWKAPAQSVGPVTFYAAGNAANGNSDDSGDLIYTTNVNIQPAGPLRNFASVSAASFSQDMTGTADSIMAGFGTDLSQNTVSAPRGQLPLPTQLDGTEVEVKDSAGTSRNAGLFFVSPQQANYLVPTGTANGAATVTVKRSGTAVAQGTLTIATVATGLFSANANGQGVAAAVILRRRAGVDTFEDVARLNPTTGRFEPIMLDLGPAGDQVFLVGFGTGFRAAPQSAVSATIGGTASTFVATAIAPGFVGLDQVNILIPRSLAGSNMVYDVVFTASGVAANKVQIGIK